MSLDFFIASQGNVSLVPVWQNAGAPTNGTSGTLANVASAKDLLVDTTNGVLYLNTGTSANVAWTSFTGTGGSPTFANVAATGFVRGSYSAGLTAVGTSRANALALTSQTNHVTAAATTAVGVVLPASASVGVGGIVRVIAEIGLTAASFHVYAAGSDTIDGTAGSTGVVLTTAFLCDYQVDAAGAFISYRAAVTRSA